MGQAAASVTEMMIENESGNENESRGGVDETDGGDGVDHVGRCRCSSLSCWSGSGSESVTAGVSVSVSVNENESGECHGQHVMTS